MDYSSNIEPPTREHKNGISSTYDKERIDLVEGALR